MASEETESVLPAPTDMGDHPYIYLRSDMLGIFRQLKDSYSDFPQTELVGVKSIPPRETAHALSYADFRNKSFFASDGEKLEGSQVNLAAEAEVPSEGGRRPLPEAAREKGRARGESTRYRPPGLERVSERGSMGASTTLLRPSNWRQATEDEAEVPRPSWRSHKEAAAREEGGEVASASAGSYYGSNRFHLSTAKGTSERLGPQLDASSEGFTATEGNDSAPYSRAEALSGVTKPQRFSVGSRSDRRGDCGNTVVYAEGKAPPTFPRQTVGREAIGTTNKYSALSTRDFSSLQAAPNRQLSSPEPKERSIESWRGPNYLKKWERMGATTGGYTHSSITPSNRNAPLLDAQGTGLMASPIMQPSRTPPYFGEVFGGFRMIPKEPLEDRGGSAAAKKQEPYMRKPEVLGEEGGALSSREVRPWVRGEVDGLEGEKPKLEDFLIEASATETLHVGEDSKRFWEEPKISKRVLRNEDSVVKEAETARLDERSVEAEHLVEPGSVDPTQREASTEKDTIETRGDEEALESTIQEPTRTLLHPIATSHPSIATSTTLNEATENTPTNYGITHGLSPLLPISARPIDNTPFDVTPLVFHQRETDTHMEALLAKDPFAEANLSIFLPEDTLEAQTVGDAEERSYLERLLGRKFEKETPHSDPLAAPYASFPHSAAAAVSSIPSTPPGVVKGTMLSASSISSTVYSSTTSDYARLTPSDAWPREDAFAPCYLEAVTASRLVPLTDATERSTLPLEKKENRGVGPPPPMAANPIPQYPPPTYPTGIRQNSDSIDPTLQSRLSSPPPSRLQSPLDPPPPPSSHRHPTVSATVAATAFEASRIMDPFSSPSYEGGLPPSSQMVGIPLSATTTKLSPPSSTAQSIPPTTPLTFGGNVSTALDKPIWYYRDPKGFVQGPFSSDQMYKWWQGSFFPANLPMRYDHSLPWMEFSSFFPRNTEPFKYIPRITIPSPSTEPTVKMKAEPHTPTFFGTATGTINATETEGNSAVNPHVLTQHYTDGGFTQTRQTGSAVGSSLYRGSSDRLPFIRALQADVGVVVSSVPSAAVTGNTDVCLLSGGLSAMGASNANRQASVVQPMGYLGEKRTYLPDEGTLREESVPPITRMSHSVVLQTTPVVPIAPSVLASGVREGKGWSLPTSSSNRVAVSGLAATYPIESLSTVAPFVAESMPQSSTNLLAATSSVVHSNDREAPPLFSNTPSALSIEAPLPSSALYVASLHPTSGSVPIPMPPTADERDGVADKGQFLPTNPNKLVYPEVATKRDMADTRESVLSTAATTALSRTERMTSNLKTLLQIGSTHSATKAVDAVQAGHSPLIEDPMANTKDAVASSVSAPWQGLQPFKLETGFADIMSGQERQQKAQWQPPQPIMEKPTKKDRQPSNTTKAVWNMTAQSNGRAFAFSEEFPELHEPAEATRKPNDPKTRDSIRPKGVKDESATNGNASNRGASKGPSAASVTALDKAAPTTLGNTRNAWNTVAPASKPSLNLNEFPAVETSIPRKGKPKATPPVTEQEKRTETAKVAETTDPLILELQRLCERHAFTLDTVILTFLQTFETSDEIYDYLKNYLRFSTYGGRDQGLDKFSVNFLKIVDRYRSEEGSKEKELAAAQAKALPRGKKKRSSKPVDLSSLGIVLNDSNRPRDYYELA